MNNTSLLFYFLKPLGPLEFKYTEIGPLTGVLRARLRHAYMTRISVIGL